MVGEIRLIEYHSASSGSIFNLHSSFPASPGWVTGFELRVTGFELRVAGFGLRVAGFELRDSGYGVRVAGCELRITGYELRVSGYELRGPEVGWVLRTINSRVRRHPSCNAFFANTMANHSKTSAVLSNHYSITPLLHYSNTPDGRIQGSL